MFLYNPVNSYLPHAGASPVQVIIFMSLPVILCEFQVKKQCCVIFPSCFAQSSERALLILHRRNSLSTKVTKAFRVGRGTALPNLRLRH